MSLDQWQERLQSHFAQLASLRSYLDFPLFALEHGLTEDEFDEITDLLHAQLEEDGWKLDHCSLNIDTFDPIYVLMGHALPEEAPARPVQRGGDTQAGVHPQVSN
jgi:hypothetical protein